MRFDNEAYLKLYPRKPKQEVKPVESMVETFTPSVEEKPKEEIKSIKTEAPAEQEETKNEDADAAGE